MVTELQLYLAVQHAHEMIEQGLGPSIAIDCAAAIHELLREHIEGYVLRKLDGCQAAREVLAATKAKNDKRKELADIARELEQELMRSSGGRFIPSESGVSA